MGWRSPNTLMTALLVDVFLAVDARRYGWQATGLTVEPGMTVRLEVVDGLWTHFQGRASYSAGAGEGYICAESIPASECVESLPDFPQGDLIGRIGEQAFGVGRETTVVAGQPGDLALRINDADHALYDNDGALTVRASIQR